MTIMTDKKKTILEAVEKLTDTYRKEELFLGKDRERLPNKKEIINFIKDMRSIIFPGYFSVDSSASVFPEHYVAYRLNDLYDCLQEQIEIAFLYQGEEEQKAKEHAEQITERFFANVPEIQRMLLTDLQAGFDGDPAAKSKEEIIFSYPGFYAIYVYRLAHVLYLENVPFIPRIMSEYAHGYTGIDINPGATIGEYFFIDHGTGVVIGETTEIGRNVKLYQGEEEQKAKEHAEQITERFFANVPEIQRMLLTDLQAGFDGDPAAKSKEEIIFSYPGFYAIYVYRLAHVLYLENVPFIPRIMSEYAHGYTGIDINPGATIGEYFFIDHGTGVVIGETTEIGKNVKLYQGVTLGALSTRQGQLLANVKRHPTIRDNVTIYSNSSVLGGETVIGENTIIGGNTFITASIPANTKVSAKSPELVIKKPRSSVEATNVWDWEN